MSEWHLGRGALLLLIERRKVRRLFFVPEWVLTKGLGKRLLCVCREAGKRVLPALLFLSYVNFSWRMVIMKQNCLWGGPLMFLLIVGCDIAWVCRGMEDVKGV